MEKLIYIAVGAAIFYLARLAWVRLWKWVKEKNAKHYLKEHLQDYELTRIYRGKDEKGNALNWYAFTNPLKMPASRSIIGEVAMKHANMNMTRESLLEFVTGMKEAANQGQIVELFSDLVEIETRLNYACEEETLLDLACCYFMIEGEDPRANVKEIMQRKKKLIRGDEAAMAFFLTAAYKITGTLGDISKTDILNYLQEQKTRLKPKTSVFVEEQVSPPKEESPKPKRGGIFSGKSRTSSTKSTSKTS